MIDSRLCFVAMPFAPDLRNVYDAVEGVVKDYCGLKCVRADRIARSERITDDIRDYIKNARLVIADLTGINPNVFYEVGMAHGRDKRVILMVQEESKVPFDLRDVRYLEYDPQDLLSLKQKLTAYIRNCISTVPQNWDRNFHPGDWTGAYTKITSLEAPSTVELNCAFEIEITARNNGPDAHQGYFSISFPDGVDNLSFIESNADTQVGLKGDSWCGDRLTLSYPIAEGFKWGDADPVWPSGKQYLMNVKGYPKRRGLLWFYVNASAYDKPLDGRRWDPESQTLDADQRDENVYCGTIEVISRGALSLASDVTKVKIFPIPRINLTCRRKALAGLENDTSALMGFSKDPQRRINQVPIFRSL